MDEIYGYFDDIQALLPEISGSENVCQNKCKRCLLMQDVASSPAPCVFNPSGFCLLLCNTI